MKRLLKLLLLPCVSLAGCVAEPPANVTGELHMEFAYLSGTRTEAPLSTVAGGVTAYVFDRSTGVLADVVRVGGWGVSRGSSNVRLSPGVYTLVCWASGSGDLQSEGYDGVRIDGSEGGSTSAEAGVTSLDDFRMTLLCDGDEATRGWLRPHVMRFDDLFYAFVREVEIGSCTRTTARFDFMRNTSVIKVRVTGANHLITRDMTRFSLPDRMAPEPEIFVTAPHERYMWDNTLDPSSRLVRFELPLSSPRAGVVESDIKVQRLLMGAPTDERVLLYVRNPLTDKDLFAPIDVMQAILSAVDADGNRPWQTQEEIDAQYEFFVTLDVGLVSTDVTLKINGYEVVDLDVELNKPERPE